MQNGSQSPPYEATQERDNAGGQSVVLHYQSISCMPAYKNSSFEVSETLATSSIWNLGTLVPLSHACDRTSFDIPDWVSTVLQWDSSTIFPRFILPGNLLQRFFLPIDSTPSESELRSHSFDIPDCYSPQLRRTVLQSD